ncbi:MAG: hypothetical protein A2541_01345 [Candidatus Taylorbacteria bacterium RIFOXYD2_FULL_36_9]|uniref:Glycosyl transferase family 1 domain-containing protein n=1 Tax=Candidatus Taylorbacteria bacterium RIFOXYD2_FULL_36_9 TaxID=1802338 RepID=A0A1G2PEN8_9BACT|nr:MAG: hypothetical protein A2541_01345 [Candidatus Taylorbacteria bacterium RIFOXYD2_FULL_36_9]
MKIGFIARGLTNGGVKRYVENFLETFNTFFYAENSLVLLTDQPDFKEKYKNIQVVYLKKSSKFFWDYVKIIPFLFKSRLDVVFYPKSIIPLTHLLFKFKKIIIIHDLAYFDNKINEYKFLDTIYMKLFMGFSGQQADLIIADSLATKLHIENILKIKPDKIKIVYLAVEKGFQKITNSNFIKQTLAKLNVAEHFLFYCGSLSPRKNILRVLEAFNLIKNKIPHNIYLASGQSWKDKAIKKFIQEDLSDRVFLLGKVSDEELVCLYSRAEVFLFPSLYEGFGLPILEAQACGCPVLTSNQTSCPEVAGEGAVIVNPYKVEEIKTGILKLIEDFNFRQETIKKGLLNKEKYSWIKTVTDLIKYAKDLNT